jgi:hypothetical protein
MPRPLSLAKLLLALMSGMLAAGTFSILSAGMSAG